MSRFLPLLAALLLTGCYDARFGPPDAGPQAPAATAAIADLRAQYLGKPFTVAGDFAVAGTVTSCDRAENCYRSLCIEDGGAALEVMVGLDHLHTDFPMGCRVTLRLQGLTVAESRGILQVGRPPAAGSGYAVDYLGSQAALDAALSRNGETLVPVEPAVRTLAQLTPQQCGTLVAIGALRYTPEDLSNPTWAGYKRFTDAEGRTIRTYVRTYARFADREVPVGPVALTGILQRDGDGYLLKLRDETDCRR